MEATQMPERIAMKQPFASGAGEGGLTAISNQTGNMVNFVEGFPSVYAAPASSGGKYVSRGEMNALGNLASNDLFYHKCGGINVFDAALSNVIGGYPKGAILKYHHNDFLYDVISLQENNTWNYIDNGIDNEHWAYLSVPDKKVDDVFFEGGSGVASGDTLLGVIKAYKTGGLVIKSGVTPVWVDNGTQVNWSSSSLYTMTGVSVGIKDLGETIPQSTKFPHFQNNEVTWEDWLNLSGDYGRVIASSETGYNIQELSSVAGAFGAVIKDHYYALALLCGRNEVRDVITSLTLVNFLDFSSLEGTIKINYA